MSQFRPHLLRDFLDSYLPEYLNTYEANKESISDLARILCSSGDIIGYWMPPSKHAFLQHIAFWNDELYRELGHWMATTMGLSNEQFEHAMVTWETAYSWHILFEWATVSADGVPSVWDRTGREFPFSKRSEAIIDYIWHDVFPEGRTDQSAFFRRLVRRLQISRILKQYTPLASDIVRSIVQSV